MSLDALKVGSDVDQANADVLPGAYTLPSGLYPMVVELAYLAKSKSGALSLRVHFKAADGSGGSTRQTFWVTSGDAKGNKNYYTTKDGKKRLLPGMEQANQLAIITTGKGLGELNAEKKTVKLWNPTTSSEEPTDIEAITAMHNQKVLVGLHKVRDNKVSPDGAGNYIKQADDRFFNEVDKMFYPDGRTVAEAAADEAAAFHTRWSTKYPTEFVDDRYVAVAGSQPDLPGVDKPTSGGVASLFGSDS